jgi:putative CocE/NonD family hydrolase
MGALSPTPMSCRGADAYSHNPASRNLKGNGIIPEESNTLNADPARGDLLMYETQPFEADTTLAAPGELDLWFSSSAHDADFFVIVYDRDEKGVARALGGPGKMRMSFRNGYSKGEPLKPGRVYRGSVELRPFAHRFAKGHRLGIIIRSEWFPAFVTNLNTGEPIKSGTRSEIAKIRLFRGPGRQSKLRLWAL